MQRGVSLARTCLDEDREPTEDEGRPYLDGTSGELAWQDGLELRKTFARFYGPDRLHRPLPASFGDVSWEGRDADNNVIHHKRAMTRCDMLCSEVQGTRRMDIDFSDKPSALEARVRIATDYVAEISRHGVWCSTPSIVAFSIARIEKRPVRVYFVTRDSLYRFADTVPDGALPPPPPHLDEFLLDFHAAAAARVVNPIDNDDDIHAISSPSSSSSSETCSSSSKTGHLSGATLLVPPEESEKSEESKVSNAANPIAAGAGLSDSESEEEDDDVDPASFTQDVTRVLFNGGHYDLALTASERACLVRVFPETARHLRVFPEFMKAKLRA